MCSLLKTIAHIIIHVLANSTKVTPSAEDGDTVQILIFLVLKDNVLLLIINHHRHSRSHHRRYCRHHGHCHHRYHHHHRMEEKNIPPDMFNLKTS